MLHRAVRVQFTKQQFIYLFKPHHIMGSCQGSLCWPPHKSCSDYWIFPFLSSFSTSHIQTDSSILPMDHRQSWAQKKWIQAARMPSESLGGVCDTVSTQRRSSFHSQFASLHLLGEVGKHVPPRRQLAGYLLSPSSLQLFPQEAGNQDLNPFCWRYFTVDNMPEATRVYDIPRWVGALNHNTEAVLFFLK